MLEVLLYRYRYISIVTNIFRKIKVLRANIRLNRLATADVGKEIAGVRKRHRRRISKIAAVRAELEVCLVT